MKQIQELFKEDKPRERLLLKGRKALKNRELIALILESGSKQYPLMTVAKSLETLLEKEQLNALDIKKLTEVSGVGISKACQIIAAFELAGRFYVESEKPQITSSDDVVPLLKEYADKNQEHFLTITLDGSKHLIGVHLTFIGTLNFSVFHPREVFATACTDRADTIIVAHNHPSGNIMPSVEDQLVTKQLREVGRMMGIELVDHIIFTKKNGYYSFAGNNAL